MSRKFNRILVPVDFSPYSTEALRHAAGIAERYSSSVLALHVIAEEVQTYAISKPREYGGFPNHVFALLGPFSQKMEASTAVADVAAVDLRERAYTALQQSLPFQHADFPLELRVEIGEPFEQILATARRDYIDLIVMGTHGRTGLAHLRMGSIAERVVRHVSCPVLTVKSGMPLSS